MLHNKQLFICLLLLCSTNSYWSFTVNDLSSPSVHSDPDCSVDHVPECLFANSLRPHLPGLRQLQYWDSHRFSGGKARHWLCLWTHLSQVQTLTCSDVDDVEVVGVSWNSVQKVLLLKHGLSEFTTRLAFVFNNYSQLHKTRPQFRKYHLIYKSTPISWSVIPSLKIICWSSVFKFSVFDWTDLITSGVTNAF